MVFRPDYETKETHLQDVLSNPRIDAVVLATPVSTHYGFAQQALLAGKHVLVGKPMTTRTNEALDFIELAEKPNGTELVSENILRNQVAT
jgi:predicted dehydrogenase